MNKLSTSYPSSCSIEMLGTCLLHAPDSIFITDHNGKYIEVNDAACTILEYTRDELLAMSVGDFVPESRKETERELFLNLTTQKSVKIETIFQSKSGRIIPIALDAVLLPDGSTAAFCKDISALKDAQKKVAESEQFTRILLDTIPLPVFYKDIELRYLGVNRTFADFYGRPAESFIGKTVYDIAPEDIANVYDQYDKKTVTTENIQIYQSKVATDTNGIRDVIFHKTVFKNSEGNPGGVIGIIVDITEQLKLRKNQDLYFSAIQSLDQPILITETDGTLISINRAFSAMYGYSKEEIIGKKPSVLNPGKQTYTNLGYTEETYTRIFSSMWEAIKNPEIGAWNDIIINRRKDGTLIWVRLMINTIYDADGNPSYFIGLPIDVTSVLLTERANKIELYHTIAAMADLRDNETGNHMRRVGLFTKLIARAKKMPEKYCNDMEIFAPMHDIGKVGIIDSILLAERGLTNEEFETMKTHTTLGYNIVKGKAELDMVAAITLNHHERFDGKGYPNGIKGESIPLSARMTMIADVYDAIRSRRSYKQPFSHEQTLAIMAPGRGTQFDPELFDIFINSAGQFENIYRELKDD